MEEEQSPTIIYQAPRSEEMNEIISQPPNWLIRWGITLLSGLVIVLVLCSCLIDYPDIVRAPFKLTSTNAPKSINSKIDGKLSKLLIRNNATVVENQVLGYMETTADPEQILLLEKKLKTLIRTIELGQATEKFGGFNKLGELQDDYRNFIGEFTNFMNFQGSGYFLKKRELLRWELLELNRIEKNLLDQQQIQQQTYSIAENEFKVHKGLAEQKVIAPLELRKEESKLLEKRMPLKQTESTLYNNASIIIAKQKEILEMDKLIREHKQVFLQSLNSMISKVEAWKSRYVLTAPISGRVYFSSFLEERQSVFHNQEIFFIGPEMNTYFGEVHIPQYNLGKVKEGQEVIIKFESYPFNEFGAVKGRVSFISDITDKDNNFLIKVELPSGLKTTFGKKINSKTGMNASAEIITENMRLIERFFYSLRKGAGR